MKGTISGSFRKFYQEICNTYEIFEQNGITILSPRNSKIINPTEDFVILETDSKELGIKELEDMHLEAIANSDFLYLVNPNSYIGDSGKFEMGFAHGNSVPIYSSHLVTDVVLRKYINGIYSPEELVDVLKRN